MLRCVCGFTAAGTAHGDDLGAAILHGVNFFSSHSLWLTASRTHFLLTAIRERVRQTDRQTGRQTCKPKR
jgi:hypothetical protein